MQSQTRMPLDPAYTQPLWPAALLRGRRLAGLFVRALFGGCCISRVLRVVLPVQERQHGGLLLLTFGVDLFQLALFFGDVRLHGGLDCLALALRGLRLGEFDLALVARAHFADLAELEQERANDGRVRDHQNDDRNRAWLVARVQEERKHREQDSDDKQSPPDAAQTTVFGRGRIVCLTRLFISADLLNIGPYKIVRT